MWLALLETGGRFGEVVLAPWSDVDLDKAKLRLRAQRMESHRERWLPLRPYTAEVLPSSLARSIIRTALDCLDRLGCPAQAWGQGFGRAKL